MWGSYALVPWSNRIPGGTFTFAGETARLRIEWQDSALGPLLIPKGSVAVDGVSLTVAELDGEVLRRARAAYPLLRDENIELVHREVSRIRQERFQVPAPAERRRAR